MSIVPPPAHRTILNIVPTDLNVFLHTLLPETVSKLFQYSSCFACKLTASVYRSYWFRMPQLSSNDDIEAVMA